MRTFTVGGVVVAMLKVSGRAGGYVASGRTAREAIDRVLAIAQQV